MSPPQTRPTQISTLTTSIKSNISNASFISNITSAKSCNNFNQHRVIAQNNSPQAGQYYQLTPPHQNNETYLNHSFNNQNGGQAMKNQTESTNKLKEATEQQKTNFGAYQPYTQTNNYNLYQPILGNATSFSSIDPKYMTTNMPNLKSTIQNKQTLNFRNN